MTTYIIKIYKDGIYADTQDVTAATEGKVISTAMAQTRVPFRSALASYEGREQGETDFRPFVRDI